MLEDVRDSMEELVGVIKTYNKSRLSQVIMSSLFKTRQEEAEAVITMTIARLQVSQPRNFEAEAGAILERLRILYGSYLTEFSYFLLINS